MLENIKILLAVSTSFRTDKRRRLALAFSVVTKLTRTVKINKIDDNNLKQITIFPF